MAFRFRCPACSAELRAPAEMAGASVRCPECDAALEVPRPAAAPSKAQQPTVAVAAAGGRGGSVPERGTAAEEPVHFGQRKPLPRDELDMTPMVDVTFLLLIFFMVTAAFALQKSFEVPNPESSEPSTQARTLEDFQDDPQYVVVRVDRHNTFHIAAAHWDLEQEAPGRHDLLVKLRDARRGPPGGAAPTRMLVLAHGLALHEYVVAALDAGTAVGMDEVKLITVEEDQ